MNNFHFTKGKIKDISHFNRKVPVSILSFENYGQLKQLAIFSKKIKNQITTTEIQNESIRAQSNHHYCRTRNFFARKYNKSM